MQSYAYKHTGLDAYNQLWPYIYDYLTRSSYVARSS